MKRILERVVSVSDAGRSFDIKFWQAQGAAVRFKTAFDMLKDFYRIKGEKKYANTFRLQRSVENIKQAPG